MSQPNNISGWMSNSELAWLAESAAKMQTFLEIGSWKGRSTYGICSACPGTVMAVDTWEGEDGSGNGVKISGVYEEFLENLSLFLNSGKLSHMRKSSQDAAASTDNSFEMVFIDGDHRYINIRRDIDLWLPKCTKLICGHDYFYGDIARAVGESFKADKITRPADSIWAVWL